MLELASEKARERECRQVSLLLFEQNEGAFGLH